MYWITGILGAAMIIAPFIFGYSDNTAALWTSISIGLIVGVASWLEGIGKDREDWEYWIAELLGLFAIVAPFVFGFSTHSGAMWTSMTMGVLIAIMAGSRLWIGSASRR